jgi:hypothetical protein
MAQLSVQSLSAVSALNPSYQAAAAGGDSFPNTAGRAWLHVKNGSGGSINVTIASQKTCDQGSTHNLVVAVPAAGERLIGPFSDRFADSNGLVQVTYSGVTSLTVGAFNV